MRMRFRFWGWGWRVTLLALVCCILALGLQGCRGPIPEEPLPRRGYTALEPAQAEELAREAGQNLAAATTEKELTAAVQRSLEYVRQQPPQALAVDVPGLTVRWNRVEHSLERMLEVIPRLWRDPEVLAQEFTWYALRPGPLFTGYYEPELSAALEKRAGYDVPLYKRPQDLRQVDLGRFHPRWEGQRLRYRIENGTIAPYYDREAIESEGALQGRGLELAWAKDPVDVFFLQIQGSGRLRLPDGRVQSVRYAGANGREYVSLGQFLLREGYLESGKAGMQDIRDFLQAHPEQRQEFLNTNPSYVFFEKADDGPYGAMGKLLTPFVSLATDRSVLPLGGLTVWNADLPAAQSNSTVPFTSVGLTQDVGGAITGHHFDLYCGSGDQAGALAGKLKTRGRMFFLLAKNATQPDVKE